MALRDIIILPDKRLRLVSEPVKTSTRRCARWSRTCSRPCTRRPASGLPRSRSASRSASSPWTSPRRTSRSSRRCSSIRRSSGRSDEKSTYEEGCLSIPEYYEEVERPAQVKVRYLDLDGKAQEIEAERPARDLPAARDRPPQRRAVHRPHLQAQARPRHQEIHQGGEARSCDGVECRSASSSWARRTSRCRR